jgi:hypothetical protein
MYEEEIKYHIVEGDNRLENTLAFLKGEYI